MQADQQLRCDHAECRGGGTPRPLSAPPEHLPQEGQPPATHDGRRMPGLALLPLAQRRQVLLQLGHTQLELQRQRTEQSEWAAEAARLLREHGYQPQPLLPGGAHSEPKRRWESLEAQRMAGQAGQDSGTAAPCELRGPIASLQADIDSMQLHCELFERQRQAHLRRAARVRAAWNAQQKAEQAAWEQQRHAQEAAWQ